MAWLFYIAAAVGAVAVFFTLPHGRTNLRLGLLLGAVALGGLLLALGLAVPAGGLPGWYFYIFAIISLLAAARVITHPRPVYSALYFVLVVLSSAGLLVLLEAEFMAFAMVIIYGGAILVTYMFVIMFATLPQTAEQPETAAEYDRQAREPVGAAVMGFVLLAVLSHAIFGPPTAAEVEEPAVMRQRAERAWDEHLAAAATMGRKIDVERETDRREIESALRAAGTIEANEFAHDVNLEEGRVLVRRGIAFEASIGARGRWVDLDEAVLRQFIGNIDYVGLDLFRKHTLGIELAGVILLLAMVGAIVIAKRRVPELRTAAETISRPATEP